MCLKNILMRDKECRLIRSALFVQVSCPIHIAITVHPPYQSSSKTFTTVVCIVLNHWVLNRLSHTIYWKSPISILGMSSYIMYIFLEKKANLFAKSGAPDQKPRFSCVCSGSALFANYLLAVSRIQWVKADWQKCRPWWVATVYSGDPIPIHINSDTSANGHLSTTATTYNSHLTIHVYQTSL